MALVISEVEGLEASPADAVKSGMVFEPEVITRSAASLAKERAAMGPLPAIVPPKAPEIDRTEFERFWASGTQPAPQASQAVRQAAEEDDQGGPRKIPTWAWVAGGSLAVVVAGMLLWPVIKRSPRPAMAGVGRGRRSRRRSHQMGWR